MDNSGDGPLRVPGFTRELPREFQLPSGAPAFTTATQRLWYQDPRLTVRELAMLGLMSRIMDQPDWSTTVFQEDVVTGWKAKAKEEGKPMISDSVYDWCIAELRDKAAAYKKTGYVLALDSGSRVGQADGLVPGRLRHQLSSAAERLSPSAASDEYEKQLVDPMLYPLVYGRSAVLVDGGVVDLDDIFASCGKGTVAPEPTWKGEESRDVLRVLKGDRRNLDSDRVNASEVRTAHTWSRRFQRLPCEFQFRGGEGSPTGEITSYINGLHPSHYKDLYGCISSIISLAVPIWNDVLILNGRDRSPVRIRTYGAEKRALPDWMSSNIDAAGEEWRVEFPGLEEKVKAYLALPDLGVPPNPEKYWTVEDWDVGEDWESRMFLWDALCTKHKRLGRYLHPEPGVSFNYKDWKAGRTAKAKIPKEANGNFRPGVDKDHEYYTVSLQDTFQKEGLQVIVGMTSIELSPDNPTAPVEPWQLQGLLNDHVVATAICFFEVDNIATEARLSFQQKTRLALRNTEYHPMATDEWGDHQAIAAVFGVPENADYGGEEPSEQALGSVSVRTGRMVVFPNVLEFRREALCLADETRPGRLRYLILELVDPHYRVCSTRNVPPQRHDWWVQASLAQIDWAARGVPEELIAEIADRLPPWPIGQAEAVALRDDFRVDKELFLCYWLEFFTARHDFIWSYI